MIIDLLRHGETQREAIFRGVTDDPLSDVGWSQMVSATKGENWHKVITSPLQRCHRFAQHVAQLQACTLETDDRLSEYDFGDWDGKPYADVLTMQAQQVQQFFNDPGSHTPPNGECYRAFRDRVLEVWQERVAQSQADRKILLVTHGGVMLVILAHVLGVKYIHGKIRLPYACRSQIRVEPGNGTPCLVSHR